MNPVSRRIFLKATGATGAAALAGNAEAAQQRPLPAAPKRPDGAYLFFNAPEAEFIEAAVARLIPPDALGPSALEAGVPNFIDLQMHGAWGAGERLYRSGPWQDGVPT